MQEPRLVHTIENLYDIYIKIYQQNFALVKILICMVLGRIYDEWVLIITTLMTISFCFEANLDALRGDQSRTKSTHPLFMIFFSTNIFLLT